MMTEAGRRRSSSLRTARPRIALTPRIPPSMQVAMELLALITLRVTEPELHRPFRIPLRTPALALLCAPALAFCLGVVVLSLYNGRATRIFWAFAIVAGAAGSCDAILPGWAAKYAPARKRSDFEKPGSK